MKLFKTLLLIVLLTVASTTVSAQRYGIRAGANISSLSGGDADVNTKTGFYVGVFKEMTILSDLFYIQPELQYSSQGFSSDFSGSDEDYAIDYINVPILAKVYVVKLFSFEAGPQFGFKVSDDFDGGSDVESVDPAGVVGLNINLPLRLSINMRYIFGFSEVIEDTDSKTQVFQIGGSYRF